MKLGEVSGVSIMVSPERYEEIKKQQTIYENEILRELQEENDLLQDRINKAIELLLDKYVRGLLNDNEVNNIVKILKGDNK